MGRARLKFRLLLNRLRLSSVSSAVALSLALGSATWSCGSEDTGGNGADGDGDGDGNGEEETRDSGKNRPEKDAGGGTDKPPVGKGEEETTDPVIAKPEDGVNKCAGIRQDRPAAVGGVDVIFLIDTSGSMLHAITQVTQNMAAFVERFKGSKADVRIVMITGNDPAGMSDLAREKDKYMFIRSEVDSKALFTVALAQFPTYQSFLRSNAATQFVMVTDDEDAVPPAEFKRQMEALLGHPFTQHAIASPRESGGPCINELAVGNPLCIPGLPIPAICGAAAVGENYYALADDTNGQKLSICKGDWSTIFGELEKAVIEAVPLPCDYPLSQASKDDFDRKKVNTVYTPENGKATPFPKASSRDKCGDSLGWHYDDEAKPSVINLCPKACEAVQKGGTIDIEFGCEPPIII